MLFYALVAIAVCYVAHEVFKHTRAKVELRKLQDRANREFITTVQYESIDVDFDMYPDDEDPDLLAYIKVVSSVETAPDTTTQTTLYCNKLRASMGVDAIGVEIGTATSAVVIGQYPQLDKKITVYVSNQEDVPFEIKQLLETATIVRGPNQSKSHIDIMYV